MRAYKHSRDVTAHCERCNKTWTGPNAQGVAARHTDATGHETYVDIYQSITYYRKGEE